MKRGAVGPSQHLHFGLFADLALSLLWKREKKVPQRDKDIVNARRADAKAKYKEFKVLRDVGSQMFLGRREKKSI